MWSNFAQRQQQPPAPAPAPPAPAPEEEPQPPPAELEQPRNDIAEDSNDEHDAWNDDDAFLEDDLFADEDDDDVKADNKADAGGATKDDNEGGAFSSMSGEANNNNNSAIAATERHDIANTPGSSAISGIAGGLGGWGRSTLQSFASPHKPLDLSFAPPINAPPPTAAASTVPAIGMAHPTTSQPDEFDEGDGWDDDDDILSDSIMDSPKNEPTAVPLTPLGRAAESLGAALLASMDNDSQEEEDDGDGYTDENHDDDDQESEHAEPGAGGGGFGGGFVMKGLSRFIEAATAPQEQHDDEFSAEEEEDEGGWGDDDDLDFHDEENNDNTDKDNHELLVQDGVAEKAGTPPIILEDKKETESPQMMPEMATSVVPPAAKVEVDAELALQEEDEEPMADDAGEGWDDIDISFNSPGKTDTSELATTPKQHVVDSGKSYANIEAEADVPDSIKDFVAMTELALDNEFENTLWKTPSPKAKTTQYQQDDDDDDISASSDLGNDLNLTTEVKVTQEVVAVVDPVAAPMADPMTDNDKESTTKPVEINGEGDKQEGVEDNMLSKSLTEFVDNLDAELNDFSIDATTAIAADTNVATVGVERKATTEATMEEAASTSKDVDLPAKEGMTAYVRKYTYEENKDDSPEPVQHPTVTTTTNIAQPTLPHQESWYLNAMEDGKGGVVYGEEEALEASNTSPTRKGLMPMIPGGGSIIQCPSSLVGMPLSEMPSSANSLGGMSKASTITQPEDPLKQSELQCNCLQLIMPLPNNNIQNGTAISQEKPGFGSKTLPDGTTVLVNYEKLLQNEVTKRILLQRSAEAYEHTLEKMQQRHQTALQQSALDQKEMINTLSEERNSALDEVSNLRELVMTLQDEKENTENEAQLFEAELAAAVNDKEYLEREAESMQEDFKIRQKSMDASLLVTNEEKNRMIDQVGILQSDLMEVQQEKDTLLQDIKDNATTAKLPSTMDMELKGKIESLQQELLEKDSEIELLNRERDSLNEQVQELKSNNAAATEATHTSAEMEQLRGTIESLQMELFEKDNEIEQLNGERDELQELRAVDTFATTEATAESSETEKKLKSTIQLLEEKLCEKEKEIQQLNVEETSLGNTLQMLQQEIDEKDNRIEHLNASLADQSTSNNNALSLEHDNLRKEHNLLVSDLSQTKSTLARLQDDNESLRSMQHDYVIQIAELKSTIETMEWDDSSGFEVDKLAAEVASLTYELGAKTTEYEESVTALKALQTKLDSAESQLLEYSNNAPQQKDDNHSSDVEQSLIEENGMLSKKVADLQAACSLLEGEKLDVENSLMERVAAVQSLEMRIEGLNIQVADSTTLRDQLADVREEYTLLEGNKSEVEYSLALSANTIRSQNMQIQHLTTETTELASLRDKLYHAETALEANVRECQSISILCEEHEAEMLNAQRDREATAAKNEANVNQANEQISRLQSQIADLLRDHNATMTGMEEQLTNSLEQNSTLQAQCEEYMAKLAAVENECANISHSTSDAITKYTEQISKLKDENSELIASLEAAQLALEAKQLEASGDSSNVQQMQSTIDGLKQEMDSIAYRHQDLMDKNHSLMQEKSDISQLLEARASTAEQQSQLLKLECAKLRSHLDSTQKTCADAKQNSSSLKEQLQALKDTNVQLEDKLFESSFETGLESDMIVEENVSSLKEQLQALKDANVQLEDKLFEASFETGLESDIIAEENTALKNERDALKEELRVLSQRVDELVSQADHIASNGHFPSVEKEALFARVHSLEEQLNADNLNELRDELTSLHTERQQLDLDNEELLVQLGLMQQDKLEHLAEMEVELETLRERVPTLQEECNQLQKELEDVRSRNILSQEDNEQVKNLKNANISLRQTISQLGHEKHSFEDQIINLTRQINGFEDQIGDLTQNNEGLELQNIQTIKTLRQKLGLLELKLADKEEEVECAKEQMQRALEVKEKEISQLNTASSTRENELKEVSSKLDAANDEMGTFNSQLESIQNHYEQDHYDHMFGGGEEEKMYEDEDDDISLQGLLAEAVLDSGDDYLRSQIVVLAQALERCELQRADALERIFTERKTNAESVRLLGESVKRFYSTVRDV